MMEAVIGQGIDAIRFGWTIDDLTACLGRADKQFRSGAGDWRLCYNDMRCVFWFRDTDQRLHWIACTHPKLSMFGKRLIGLSSDELLPFMQTQLMESFDVNDYGDCETYLFPNSWIELQFEFKWLTKLCFGHLFSADDDPIWPTDGVR